MLLKMTKAPNPIEVSFMSMLAVRISNMGPNKRGFMEHILFAPFEQIGIHQHFCFVCFSKHDTFIHSTI